MGTGQRNSQRDSPEASGTPPNQALSSLYLTAAPHARLRRPTAERSRAVDLIWDAPPFGRLCYCELDGITNTIGYGKFSGQLDRDARIHGQLQRTVRFRRLILSDLKE